jgi:hypothetical protein
MAKTHHAIKNALKHQLSRQRYEPSTTAHVVRKLLNAVVAFGTTIPNRPSIVTLFGCFWCLYFRVKDLKKIYICDKWIHPHFWIYVAALDRSCHIYMRTHRRIIWYLVMWSLWTECYPYHHVRQSYLSEVVENPSFLPLNDYSLLA